MASTNTKPSQTYTVEDFILAGHGVSITYDRYSYKELLSNGTEIPILNVINDYMRDFKDHAVTVQLTDEEYRKWRYRPKLMCYDIYGNQEIYWVIMLLNGMIDVKDFNLETRKLLLIPTREMASLMSAVYNAEYKYIEDYNSQKGTL